MHFGNRRFYYGASSIWIISAFGTVGLTLGITPQLSVLSKLLIIITMFIGRLGPLTFALAIGETKKKAISKYPKENILVG